MKQCSRCNVELEEDVNWTGKGGHLHCDGCFNEQYNTERMYVDGKYISKSSPIYKAGRYKTLDDAWSHSELDSKDISGEIYIVFNKAFKEWVKVGMSINAEDRLSSYQTGSPYRDYELIKKYATDSRHVAEREIHTALEVEFERKNEWFKGSIKKIDALILEVLDART